MNATAKITPGIAYPEIDKVDRIFKVLFFALALSGTQKQKEPQNKSCAKQ